MENLTRLDQAGSTNHHPCIMYFSRSCVVTPYALPGGVISSGNDWVGRNANIRSRRWSCPSQGSRFRFTGIFRCSPETVNRPVFRDLPVKPTGKCSQIQNFEISVYRPVFRCISPVFRCFSPKNDGNSWKMMGKLCICEKKLKILGSLP